MLFGRNSSLKATIPRGRLGSNSIPDYASVSNAVPPVSNITPSTSLYPPPKPDTSNAHGVTLNGYHTDDSSGVNENDIIIAVMGPTGVGKSSFVNKAAGKTDAIIGHTLKSQTRTVQTVRCQHPDGRNIVLVDTPGFDDTYLSDSQILRIIADWLKKTYQNNIKLAGLLYLHRITDVRMSGTPLRNLAVFKDLCGDDNLRNLILVTTMWDEVEDQSIGSEREKDLCSSFWKGMIDHGSRTSRFHGSLESAWEIINCLDLGRSRPRLTPLQIQREMVDDQLLLQETAAGKTLFRSLAGEFKKVWSKLRSGARRKASSRKLSSSPLHRSIFSRSSSTLSTNCSESSWSAISDTSSVLSRDSGYLYSPVGSTSSSCSINGCRKALSAMIEGLRVAQEMADLVSIPMLEGSIGTALQIAQLIRGMEGTHHMIIRVLEHSGCFLEQIVQEKAELSEDMESSLSSFQRDLNNLQNVVMSISTRNPADRFFLYDSDVQTMMTCTTSIKLAYDDFEVKHAADGRRTLARLESQLTELRDNATLRNCDCGASVTHEE